MSAKEIGRQLEHARIDRSMTFKALARIAGVNTDTVEASEEGRARLSDVCQIADALGLQISVGAK